MNLDWNYESPSVELSEVLFGITKEQTASHHPYQQAKCVMKWPLCQMSSDAEESVLSQGTNKGTNRDFMPELVFKNPPAHMLL